MNKYTEAIQGDDVVILCDGIPMGVGEILAALNAATPPADAALADASSIRPPAGCVCTTKANDVAELIDSAIQDAELEQIIEESDARWTEDMFHVHGGELMDMLRKAAAALRARPQAVAEDSVRLDFVIRDEALVASWSKLDGTTAYRLEWETGERQSEWHESPRAAIDARIAMLAASQSATGGAT